MADDDTGTGTVPEDDTGTGTVPDDDTRTGTVPEDDTGAEAVPDDRAGTGRADEDEPPIVPGSPSVESTLFVLLGVLGALAVLWRLVRLFG